MKRGQKLDESTRSTLERLCQQFDQFLAFTHGEDSPQSAHIVKEWTNFKALIEKDPGDLQGLNRYIDKLPSQKEQESTMTPASTLIKCRSNPIIVSRKQIEKGVEIKGGPDWARLKRSTRELMQAVRRNNVAMGL